MWDVGRRKKNAIAPTDKVAAAAIPFGGYVGRRQQVLGEALTFDRDGETMGCGWVLRIVERRLRDPNARPLDEA